MRSFFGYLNGSVVILALVLLTACQSIQDQGMGRVMPPLLSRVCSADWVLQSMLSEGVRRPAITGVEVLFSCTVDGEVAGMASVNRYFGSFELANDGVLQWVGAGLASTMMAGPEPLMQQEQLFLQLLQTSCEMRLKGARLILACGDQHQLIFTKSS